MTIKEAKRPLEEEVLRRMLNTPPTPHKPPAKKVLAKKATKKKV